MVASNAIIIFLIKLLFIITHVLIMIKVLRAINERKIVFNTVSKQFDNHHQYVFVFQSRKKEKFIMGRIILALIFVHCVLANPAVKKAGRNALVSFS